ncbi:MAG: fibrobacter succinogenes major paralogous domain-containing protein, partial [Ferruginibacter sp.]
MKKLLFSLLSILLFTACKKNSTNSPTPPVPVIATLTTTAASTITSTTAVSGGNISSNGGASITARGICWNTNAGPTIVNSKTTDGSGSGIFASSITGLTAGTVYYVRAYATNSAGTAYGNEISLTTTAAPIPNVTICTQIWMLKNLEVTTYRNGDLIPEVTDPTVWSTLTTGAWCYYSNNAANGPVYGKLYNWYAVNDPRGLAPTGWHVPTDAEFTTLRTCLGGNAVAGGKLKEIGTTHWNSPNVGATNSSGFTALPAGESGGGAGINMGQFNNMWTSTEYLPLPTSALAHYLDHNNEYF